MSAQRPPVDSWEEEEVAERVENIQISAPKKNNLNINAASFVPSWLPATADPPAPSNPKPTAPAPVPAPTAEPKKVEPKVAKTPSVEKKEKQQSSPPKSAGVSKPPAPRTETPPPAPVELTKEEEEVAQEFYDLKEHLNIVFIGHVDAGKSTMGGHILFLTGMVDKRTLEKYEKEAREVNRESWYLSWALDTGKEERAKGKTVEVGKAHFETDKRKFTILDAPGHKNYVPNMIGGASQADVACLVISARKGEFETGFERGGQTREHAMLVKTAGVKKLVVVINKMDDPTVNWSVERYNECVSKLTPFLKSVGYNPKTDIDFMPVSGYTGANLKDRLEKGVFPAYDGPSLLEYLDSITLDSRSLKAPFMMPVTDKYKEMGTIVTGKVEAGRLKKGDNVMIMPTRKVVEVLSIYEEEEEVNIIKCGDNARLKLKGVEEEEIQTGFVICDSLNPIKAVAAFEAQLIILECKNIITAGYTAVMHVHTCIEEVTLSALLHLVDKKTGKKSKRPPPCIKKGQMVLARLEVTQPICLDTFQGAGQLGRFTLRSDNTTVAMGKVMKLCE